MLFEPLGDRRDQVVLHVAERTAVCLRCPGHVLAYRLLMATANRTPRRLPARVYWFRRLLVLGTALALVFACVRLLSGGGGSEDPGRQVSVVAAAPTPTAASTVAPTSSPKPTARPVKPTPPAPAQPDGPCLADQVTVVPVAGTAAAGREVPLVLQLTSSRPACTFDISSSSLVARVSKAQGKVWSTQDCPASISASSVVLRSASPTSIQVLWSGRGSDGSCSRATEWAAPGTYQVVAAAIGSEPSTAALKLTVPERPVVIKTVQPKPDKVPSIAPKAPKTPKPTTPTTPKPRP